MLNTKKFKTLQDSSLITDFLTIFIITFSVVLIFAGLILMTTDSSYPYDPAQEITPQFAISVVNLIPGVPLCITDLSSYSLSAIGLVTWIIGLNLLLIGLGLWIRHRLARLVAIAVFTLATSFQFIQFLLLGIGGSPVSIVETLLNGVITYLLISKFDFSWTKPAKLDST